MKRITLLVTMIALVAVAAGCGIDDTLKSQPVAEPEAPTGYTVIVGVQPPTSLRTEDTWGRWAIPVQAIFRTTFEESAVEHAEEAEHGHAGKSALANGIHIGRSTVEGFGIVLSAEPAEELFTIGHDGPEEIHGNGETHHLMVSLEDGFGGHAPHGHANIPGATIHLEFEVAGEEQEIELRPVQGAHGLRYEANAKVPLGAYDIHAHVSPPSLLRTHASKDRLAHSSEAEFHEFDFTSGSASGEVEVEGMKVTLRASNNPKIYGAFGMGHVPLSGQETVNFSVRLEDEHVEASGQGEIIAHCGVTATVINEKTGSTTIQTLLPMYGEHGFHYGINLSLPQRDQIVGGDSPPAVDTGGDGHGH